MSTASNKSGQLIIVGSGIACIGQLTLQAIAHIEQADVVFYVLSDAATESFVLGKNSNCIDLYKYYDEAKPRADTYVQMAEAMVQYVRQGKTVVGVFYGHPGVFVSPTHRAIGIARAEGYYARMLPGISAEDCLFADIGIDPSSAGCLTYEATEFLIAKRPLIPLSHLIIYQVGAVGEIDFKFAGFDNSHFKRLIDRLEADYGSDHTITHYIAAMLPHESPTVESFTISQFRQKEIQDKVNAISTFYLPPKGFAKRDRAIAESLGFLQSGEAVSNDFPYPWSKNPNPYGPQEKEAVAKMASHVPSTKYRRFNATPAMTQAITKLSLDPKALAAYVKNPKQYTNSIYGLTPAEKSALESGDAPRILSSMKEGHNEKFVSPFMTAAVVVAGG